jgi:2-dehydro-3-deoxygluconokinase
MPQTKTIDVVTLGESMVLLVPTTRGLLRHAHSFERFVAGAESNTAIGLARLGHRVAWISRVGDDEFGQCVLHAIQGEGVDVSNVRIDQQHPTGIYFKERRGAGITRIYYYRADSAASHLSPEDLNPDIIGSAKYLHLSGITPALSQSCREAVLHAAETAQQASVKISFDPNLRLKLWSLDEAKKFFHEVVSKVNFILLNEEEIQLLTGESNIQKAAKLLIQQGPSRVIIKMGERGARSVSVSEVVHVPALKVEVVEAVGAGDAFDAGFLSGQLRNWSAKQALRLGNIMGAFATTASGDTEGLPCWKEVQAHFDGQQIADR